MNKVDAVFYDLDNTLYRQIEDVRQRIEHCASEFRLPEAGEILSFWLKEWSEKGPAEQNYIDRVIERFSLTVDREAMIEEYRSCLTTLSLDEQVYDFLAMVRERGIKQFLITNGRTQTQIRKIESLGVRELFDDVAVASGQYAKPSSYWFTALLQRHGLGPSRCISVGTGMR